VTTLPWDSDRPLDEARVRALLAARWPDLARAPVRYLAEGWDSQVYEVAGDWLFRFPKRAEVEAAYVKETALLAELTLDGVRIPAYERTGAPCDLFPYRFVGYRKIEGRSADRVDPLQVPLEPFARQVGRALTALHAFPAERARALGVTVDMESRRLPVIRQRGLARLAQVEPVLGAELTARVRAALDDPPPEYRGAPVLVHNDLLDEHLLLDAGHALTGIIDWSDAGLGDPSMDFVGLRLWSGPELVDRAIAHYGGALGDGARERIRYRALGVGMNGAVHALSTGATDDLAWTRRALELTVSR